MKSILSDSQMPFEQKCLLFYLEKEIIEKDLEYSVMKVKILMDIYDLICGNPK